MPHVYYPTGASVPKAHTYTCKCTNPPLLLLVPMNVNSRQLYYMHTHAAP